MTRISGNFGILRCELFLFPCSLIVETRFSIREYLFLSLCTGSAHKQLFHLFWLLFPSSSNKDKLPS
uniref:Uncharacterized protein n=1 Tax=Arundo donax TaxID=35708 RepID=A0A0A9ELW7_ARUDO